MSELDELATTIRIEGARILASLIRVVGDVGIAEDAVQEAGLAAMRHWPSAGVPPEPRAWLTVVARRKAIDLLRREQQRPQRERDGGRLVELERTDLPADEVVADDMLRLIFTACHPGLAPPTRITLALRTVCGLSPAQIAPVLLSSESAVVKRLTRARYKIAAAHIPYRTPGPDQIEERLPAVCAVIHSLYTAGHAPAAGAAAYEIDLCREALRLAELVHVLLPEQPMPAAVLALLLLTEARRPARLDDDGGLVVLERQDRSRWDHHQIARGAALLAESLRRTDAIADTYQLQAAIAAEHARAADYAGTDWPEIRRLYDLLVGVAPTDGALLARAVAAAEADGPATGLALMSDLTRDARWHAVRAELLARNGNPTAAARELELALQVPSTEPERRHRERRRQSLLGLMSGDVAEPDRG